MNTRFRFVPVDKTTIKTRLRIHPDLLDSPTAYIRNHELPIRNTKPYKGKSKRGPTRNLTLDVLTYKGIKVELRKVASDPLTDATIHFNPGNCLRAHNGAVLSLDEFLDALGILVTHLKPLLSNPEDWIDLIPGPRSGGVAFWHYIEILLQYPDPDGALLAGFRNAQRGNGQTPIRHWPESMVIGGKDSTLKFGIYRKAVEMAAKEKLPPGQLAEYKHILRLEVRLKGKELVHYLGNERNVEVIDGVPRLVSFYPVDTVSGHRTAFGELKGVFRSSGPLATLKTKDRMTPLGRLLARVALDPRASHKFQEMLAYIRFYIGASTDTMGKIRKAGIAALGNLRTISKDELFSDEAYQTQPSVWNGELEEKVLHEWDDVFRHPLIYKAYKPPEPRRLRDIHMPKYLRV